MASRRELLKVLLLMLITGITSTLDSEIDTFLFIAIFALLGSPDNDAQEFKNRAEQSDIRTHDFVKLEIFISTPD
ncbi:hypothetical protein JCM31447_24600 [Fluviispira sanaruensis]|uniref:Uncharacterized protein n=1 Tax=Fluviispira sanaruensis TaxID=2493639 RepID=A0A4P2VL29_FLUSA|nr:hypothetical protein JCM31447_24600 [Fluviispira sanaruensis]